MMNQQIKQEDPNYNLTTEIPPSQRVCLFRDLPSDVQAKFLQMQSTDGDFLRLDNGVTGDKVILLLPVLAGLIFIPVVFGIYETVAQAVLIWSRLTSTPPSCLCRHQKA